MAKMSLAEKYERSIKQGKSIEKRRGTKVPVVILVDTSGSMEDNNNINKLNEGLDVYFKQMLADSTVQDHIDIAIISFGYNEVQLAVDFAHIKEQRLPVFSAGGGTPMCEAITLGMDILEDQLSVYQEKGVPFHPPHMIIMTDGMPSLSGVYDSQNRAIELKENDDEFIRTHAAFRNFMDKYGLVSITIGVGEGIRNPFFLQQFASKPGNVLKLDDTNIVEFFKLLSKSTSVLSRSVPSASNSMEFEKADSRGVVSEWKS
ncbi:MULTISPECIES: vWA domain-containing protein [Cytobacillus]|jgi:uncharacterized protein YegL|uniref:vWA domain-containing protein n=1 Tax=Cytobacillus TaxID=2675230 RepID=UPI0024944B6D|nr:MULTISPECIES: VWA domain-containing protein [Cytobacillus]